MITLEQIKLLEQKVDIALKKILELQSINANLKLKNDDLETEIALYKEQLSNNSKEDELIEKGILSVIDRLNFVEDTVRQTQTPAVETESVDETVVTESIVESTEDIIVEDEINESIEHTVIEEPIEDFSNDLIDEEIEEDFVEVIPSTQSHGMLNAAQNSAQLDIF